MSKIQRMLSAELPSRVTSAYIRDHHAKMGIDRGIVDLVCALLDTQVVGTNYSCEGHFNLEGRGSSFCHHNQIAQVHLSIKNPGKACALCMEILEKVIFDELDVRVTMKQNPGESNEEMEVLWCLEFSPRGYWDIRPQDGGMFVGVAQGWTETKAQKLLQRAFKATIKVCHTGRWRKFAFPG